MRSDLWCSREEPLESSWHDTIWLKLVEEGNVKFICCLYRSPNDASTEHLFVSLGASFDLIQEQHPISDIIIWGDFHVYNSSWLKYSNKIDTAARVAENFVITYDLVN